MEQFLPEDSSAAVPLPASLPQREPIGPPPYFQTQGKQQTGGSTGRNAGK